MYVAEKLRAKTTRNNGRSKEPWLRRRIERDIKKLRRNIGVLERKRKCELRSRERYSILERKYRVNIKGIGMVIEELKQRILAKASKIRRYEERIKQYRQNRLFTIYQNKVYREINRQVNMGKIIPNAAESRTFWSEIWDNPICHRGDAEWLKKMKGLRARRGENHKNTGRDAVQKDP